jgi:hypothetical protein
VEERAVVHPSLLHDPGYFIAYRRGHGAEERLQFHAAVVYCLHLPRSIFDLTRPPTRLIAAGRRQEPAHRIGLLPYPDAFESPASADLAALYPALILAPDTLLDEARELALEANAPLGVLGFSSLNQESLDACWKQLTSLLFDPISAKDWMRPIDAPGPRLQEMGPRTPMRLAVQFVARQFGLLAAVEPGLADADEVGLLDRFMRIHRFIGGLAALEAQDDIKDFESDLDNAVDNQPLISPVPLVLASRGFRQRGAPWGEVGIKSVDPALAEPALQVMLTHRTLACKGVGLRIDDVGESLMQRLHQLEELCSETPYDLAKIWWSIETLGSAAAAVLGMHGSILARVLPTLTFFSDFPLGLARIEGTNVPLQFIIPVSYRPVAPLNAGLEAELALVPMAFLRPGFRVLLVECLDETDKLYPYAHACWTHLRRSVQDLPGLVFDVATAGSLKDLNSILKAEPADVLVISAHGGRTPDGAFAGIWLGDELWIGSGLVNVPKLVVLSACEVAPRSSEVVSIADLLLYQGVYAVVATLIPVDFNRNANFLLRFFQVIYHSILGNEPCTTLLEAWREALCSNVLSEVLHSSSSLFFWGQIEWDRMIDRYLEMRANGDIRASHMYEDVERFLRLYTAERGVFELYKEALAPRQYFPESMFYMMMGRPERIILRDEDGEKFRNASAEFDMLGNRKKPNARPE